MQKITPFLWFNDNAQEAMNFYVSIFKNSRIVSVNRSGGTFEFDGQEFIAFNGGPHFTFTPAISLFVNCETQQEVDELWEKLSEGEKNKDADGLRTNMVCHGRSFPVF
jgi:predicted 3-demethylubiquinone-9 3-methyltransferase (glyoxalase superfamily)